MTMIRPLIALGSLLLLIVGSRFALMKPHTAEWYAAHPTQATDTVKQCHAWPLVSAIFIGGDCQNAADGSLDRLHAPSGKSPF
jgi:hypothetical protein